MPALDRLFLNTHLLLGFLPLLVGLFARRQVSACPSFAIYVFAVVATDTVLWFRPEFFRSWDYWLLQESLHGLAKLILAVELGWRIFRPFPGARASLAMALLMLSLATLAFVLRTPLWSVPATEVAQTAMTVMLQGTAWLLGAVLAGALYYRIPLHPLHRAILRGLVPFLLVFSVCLGLLTTFGWDVRVTASTGYSIALQILTIYWNVVVWRRRPPPAAPYGLVRRLQPWRRI